jgi:hypothetical protein
MNFNKRLNLIGIITMFVVLTMMMISYFALFYFSLRQ